MAKELLFISHSTHQDNYPAAWLASKLTLLGYRVFIDLEDLRVGDTFFTVIQPLIQNEAVKFITVNTKSYIEKASNPNSGVRKEINAASTITNDKNFIVPIRFDGVDFNSYPMDYVGRNSIDFNNRWGDGLNELVKELEELNIPRNNLEKNPLQLWHKAIKNKNQHIIAHETLYSNWFEIGLPDFIYVHKPYEVDKSKLSLIPSTTILEANYLICFACTETVSSIMPLISSIKFSTQDFIENELIPIDSTLTIIKPYDKLKNLLNKSFKSHCYKRGLKGYKQASQKEVFYFRFLKGENKALSVSLKKYNRTRTQLNGNKNGANWHFAISAKTELKPSPHYRLFYHVIFSDTEFNPIKDTDEQQVLRKKFSAILYNKKTFEMLLAAALVLSSDKDESHFNIQADYDLNIKVSNVPIAFNSNTSYIEPTAQI